MTEDDGYQTIVPDMGVVKVEQVDREAAAGLWRDMIAKLSECIAEKQIRAGWGMDKSTQAFAHHRQAAYNQALKDAAELMQSESNEYGRVVYGLSSLVLSLGDKSNG